MGVLLQFLDGWDGVWHEEISLRFAEKEKKLFLYRVDYGCSTSRKGECGHGARRVSDESKFIVPAFFKDGFRAPIFKPVSADANRLIIRCARSIQRNDLFVRIIPLCVECSKTSSPKTSSSRRPCWGQLSESSKTRPRCSRARMRARRYLTACDGLCTHFCERVCNAMAGSPSLVSGSFRQRVGTCSGSS